MSDDKNLDKLKQLMSEAGVDPTKVQTKIDAAKVAQAKEAAKPENTKKNIEEDNLPLEAYGDLTEAEKAKIIAEARAQVAFELREQRMKNFKKEQVAKFRSAAKPGQEIIAFALDLPGHADRVTLDGKVYFHGVTYRIPRDVYNSMIDIQARAWEHENEIGGANRDAYKGRAPVLPVVSPHGVTQTDHNRTAPMVKF